MRGFSGSRSFKLDRLPCREIAGTELFEASSRGIGGIGGICELTRGKVEVDSVAREVVVLSGGGAAGPAPESGPVAVIGTPGEDVPELRLVSDSVSVELVSLLSRPCIIARRASENDGWECRVTGVVAVRPSWLLLPNAERFELDRVSIELDMILLWLCKRFWDDDGGVLNELVDAPDTE